MTAAKRVNSLFVFLSVVGYCRSFTIMNPEIRNNRKLFRSQYKSASNKSSHRRRVLSSKRYSSSSKGKDVFWPSVKGRDVDGKEEEEEEDDDEDDEDEDEIQNVFDSILKIHCTHSEPDFLIPWQRQHQSTSTSSGFVIDISDEDSDIEERRIMTNAHSVDYGSIIQVQRRGYSEKYQATIEALANECDLAILNVQDEQFWDGLDSLEFGDLPKLQEEVEVLGYPTGGDSLSVTSGVVSRIEIQEYAQASSHLLAMQIDAAINAGNSGGPVVNEDMEIIGVAFEALEGAENIGYVVPVTVVQHFLEDIQRHGNYTGFCSLGITLNLLENTSFRKSLGMTEGQSGIQLKSINPTSPCREVLQKKDVILEVDSIELGNDGKIPFRLGERVSMACYLQTKFQGDCVSMKLLRDKKIIDNVQVPVGILQKKIPAHFQSQPPPYMVVAGLVFTTLSIPYLYASNAWEEYVSESVSYLLTESDKPLERESDQVIVLAQVLAHPKNLGYDKYGNLHLKKFNDQDVRSLQHLQTLLDQCQEEFISFEFAPGGHYVVLERATLQEVTKDVCNEHFISNESVLTNNKSCS